MTQPGFIFSRDSHVTDVAEQTRLSNQSARILARLEQGRMSRDEIAAIGRNPTARVSDIRRHLKASGRTVKCVEYNRVSGASWYAIVPLEDE